MAKMVLKASYCALATVDWSAFLSKIELKAEVEEKDVTTFASGGWVEVLGGLFKAGLSLGWKNDIADNSVDEVMWGHFLTATPIAFEVRLTNSAVSASNPKYTGLTLVKEWSPIAGSVGDVAEHDVSWPTSAAVTRGIA
jgi:hypothetical protein